MNFSLMHVHNELRNLCCERATPVYLFILIVLDHVMGCDCDTFRAEMLEASVAGCCNKAAQ
jgi:hypothetical protein